MLKISGAKAPAEPMLPKPDEVEPVEEAVEPANDESMLMSEGHEQPLLPQKLVLYMGGDFGPFQCDNCCYFGGNSDCLVVEGEIDPAGICHLFCPPNHQDLEKGPPDPSPEHEAKESPEEEALEHATGEEAQDEKET